MMTNWPLYKILFTKLNLSMILIFIIPISYWFIPNQIFFSYLHL